MSNNAEILEQARTALESIKDPETGRRLGKQLQAAELNGDKLTVKIGLTTHSSPLKNDFAESAKKALAEKFSGKDITVAITDHQRAPIPLGTVGLTAKSVITVGSGKGGVGKSTTALCMALALQKAGCRVGLLDADVYGPSVPHLTGVRGQVTKEGEKIAPLDFDGIPLMSIGFMVPPDQAVIWRGPMLHSAVTTFVRDVAWGDLDYLIIDMPPGTGDIALSMSQMLPITGAVVVCTPQEVALIDAIKAVAMFEKVKIPVVGLIENMSSFICPDNGKSYDIFGKGGAKEYAKQAKIPFLGEIPINIQMRERGDSGKMKDNFEDPNIASFLNDIAFNLAKQLATSAAANPPKAQLPVLG